MWTTDTVSSENWSLIHVEIMCVTLQLSDPREKGLSCWNRIWCLRYFYVMTSDGGASVCVAQTGVASPYTVSFGAESTNASYLTSIPNFAASIYFVLISDIAIEIFHKVLCHWPPEEFHYFTERIDYQEPPGDSTLFHDKLCIIQGNLR